MSNTQSNFRGIEMEKELKETQRKQEGKSILKEIGNHKTVLAFVALALLAAWAIEIFNWSN